MKRLVKLLLFTALVVPVLLGMSYVGARARVGQLLGSDPPFGDRHIMFAFGGIPSLPGNPRAWVFTYRSSQLAGVSGAQIFVSPTGRVLAVRPDNLEALVEAWAQRHLPPELRDP